MSFPLVVIVGCTFFVCHRFVRALLRARCGCRMVMWWLCWVVLRAVGGARNNCTVNSFYSVFIKDQPTISLFLCVCLAVYSLSLCNNSIKKLRTSVLCIVVLLRRIQSCRGYPLKCKSRICCCSIFHH